MVREMSVAVLLASSACSFSSPGGKGGDGSPGLGEPDLDGMPSDPPPAGAPESDTEDPPADVDDGQPTDDGGADAPGDQPLPPPSQPPSDDDGSGETGGDVDDDGGAAETGGVETCERGGIDVLWATDAQLASPMMLVEASEAADAPHVAVSSEPEEGVITFALDLPCAGDYYVWGLVWDFMPGAWPNPDADSFYVDVGGPEMVWRYGCQTALVAGGLSWQPLERLDGQPCATTPIVLQAPAAGTYGFALRNREAGYDSAVAGIAAIAVSSDPAADPYTAYSPY
jgi:hypothetical protein